MRRPHFKNVHGGPTPKVLIMARIAVTDGMSKSAISILEKAGHEVMVGHIEKEELLAGALKEFDAIIVRSATKLPEDVILASSGLSVIGRAGVGVDNIDLKAAGKAGIMVVNAPNASTQSVVELTIGHLLASVRHIPKSDRGLREDKWEKKLMKGTELSGKCLGLIGFGRIAQGVANVAKTLGMEIHTYDPYLPPKVAKAQGAYLHKKIDSLFKSCTHISVHCNLTEETHHLVNAKRLSMMPGKKSGIVCGNHIVNCARGGIIDEDALLSALENGTISSAALDVFEVEPLPENYQLIRHENFHGTPHIGAATLEAQNRVGLDIAENVNAALSGKKPATVVNSQYLN